MEKFGGFIKKYLFRDGFKFSGKLCAKSGNIILLATDVFYLFKVNICKASLKTFANFYILSC